RSMLAWARIGYSGSHKTDVAVISDKSRKPLRMPEMVEVGDRLAHREKALLQIELATEEHGDEFGCRAWLVRRRDQLGQPRVMVRAQLQERKGQLGKAASVLIASPLECRDVVGDHAMSAKQRRDCGDAEAAVLLGNRMRGQVFGLRHRDGAPKTLTQPSCVAEVIGMVMGR